MNGNVDQSSPVSTFLGGIIQSFHVESILNRCSKFMLSQHFDLHATAPVVFCLVLVSLFQRFLKDQRDSEKNH